jgi:hypothetical protein
MRFPVPTSDWCFSMALHLQLLAISTLAGTHLCMIGSVDFSMAAHSHHHHSPSVSATNLLALKLSLPSKLLFIGFFYLEFLLCCVCAIHVLSCSVTLPSPPGSFHVSLCIHSFICSFIHSFIQHATNTHETQT